jgi:hypothetical protein
MGGTVNNKEYPVAARRFLTGDIFKKFGKVDLARKI